MPQPGWYADPDGTPERLRWWDGTRWTDHVHGPQDAAVGARRRGPWPWVALTLALGLVAAAGLGLGLGLFGQDGPLASPATPDASTAASAEPLPSATPLPSASPTPTPAATPTRTPTPLPSVSVSTAPTPDDGCPSAEAGDGTLSDGQIKVTLPDDWDVVDSVTWLECSRAATAADGTASVAVGLSPFPATSLRDAAEYVWGVALLNAATPQTMTQTSTPVTAAGMDGWMITGTVAGRDQFDELTVIVVDAGSEPSVLITLGGTHDRSAQVALGQVVASLSAADR